MQQRTTNYLTELLGDHDMPCISLYQPTHRHHPDNKKDPICYRNLLGEMEKSLLQKYPTQEVRTLMEKFQALAHDNGFWNHRTDGLAILSSPGKFQVFDLQRTVPQLVVVAETFHIKPLLRILQSADRYQILSLNRHEAKLYEGNRDALEPVELKGIPSTITEALGEELSEQHLTVGSYGGGSRSGSGGSTPSVHAHGDKADEVDIDRDRFFRIIDRGILEHYSRPSGLPLMLATLTEYHKPFHNLSHNPFLMPDGIMMNPEALSLDELRTEAWRIIEPIYLQRLAKLLDDFQLARSRQLGSDDLDQVAQATMAGRVDTLLVEADRQIPGRIHAETGQLERSADLSSPDTGDILDDLAETVLRMKGTVVIVPKDRMPSDTGLAATYKF
jgi:hypothetical protein